MSTIANLYTREKRYPEALAEYDLWLVGARKDYEKATGLGSKCWVRAEWNHELDKALEDCTGALKLTPRWAALLFDRGVVYLRLSRYADAIRDFNQAVAYEPKFASALYCRGLAKAGQGKAADGQIDMKSAMNIDSRIADRAKELGLLPDTPAKP